MNLSFLPILVFQLLSDSDQTHFENIVVPSSRAWKHFDRWPPSLQRKNLGEKKSKSRKQISPFCWKHSLLFIAQPRASPHLDTPLSKGVLWRGVGTGGGWPDRKMLPRRQLPPNCTSTCQFFLWGRRLDGWQQNTNPRPKRLRKMPFPDQLACMCADIFPSFFCTPRHLSWTPFVCQYPHPNKREKPWCELVWATL